MMLTGVGVLCLILDLGNRVFGGYARNLWRTSWRILAVIAAGMLPILLLAGALATEGNARTAFFTLSDLFAGTAIMIFLFPPRHGIVREPARRTTISALPLPGLFLHEETILVEPPLPHGLLRFLILSDIHARSPRRLRLIRDDLASIMAEERVDAVLVLGDLANNDRQLAPLLEIIGKIPSRFGAFCVRGNHDVEGDLATTFPVLLKTNGITLLDNRTVTLPGTSVTLLGLEHPWNRSTTLPAATGFCVGLSHTPDNLPLLSQLGVTVALAGHTHGGKFWLPLIGTILNPVRLGRFLDNGWFRLGQTHLFITQGIGYFPGLANNRGEIVILTIKEAGSGRQGQAG
jgi:predicted MPP superfamily phosphohydrolase